MSIPASSSSLDPTEAARFERLAGLWWQPDGPFWPLHRLNALRSTWIRDLAAEHFGRDATSAAPLRGLAALDVGCGGGILSESLASLGAQVLGIDVVARNIAIARRHAEATGSTARYQPVGVEPLAEVGLRYDLVLSMEVVEHVADLPGFLAACCKVVKPGGLLFVATLNRTLLSLLTAKIGGEYILRWLPRGTHDWRRFVKPSELAALLARDGFAILRASGVRVNPLDRSMHLTRSMAVNYMVVAARPAA